MKSFITYVVFLISLSAYAQTATISGILNLPATVSIDTNLYLVNIQQIGGVNTYQQKLKRRNIGPNTDVYEYSIDVPTGFGYKVSMTTTDLKDVLNGVSTLDLVMIQRHILGITAFTQPIQLTQADVNMNGTITAIDLVQLRSLILGVIPTFVNGRSISIVTRETQPKFSYDITNFSASVTGLDFFRVKIGDVNGSAVGF